MMTKKQKQIYVQSLPLGNLQSRVLRGEEDARLPAIVAALEAALEDRRERFGGLGRMGPTNQNLSLIETIEICKSRLMAIGGDA
jgi:hypothetical protein